MRTYYVTAGEKEYVEAQIIETNGQDLSSCVWKVGLSTIYDTPPTDWQAPDVTTFPTTGQAIVKMLATNSIDPGRYWLWVRDEDNPEVLLEQRPNAFKVV